MENISKTFSIWLESWIHTITFESCGSRNNVKNLRNGAVLKTPYCCPENSLLLETKKSMTKKAMPAP